MQTIQLTFEAPEITAKDIYDNHVYNLVRKNNLFKERDQK